MSTLFLEKYDEFAQELLKTCPELKTDIELALFISATDKVSPFKQRVLPSCSPKRDATSCPGMVLPGVVITPEMWNTFSTAAKEAVQQFLTLLSFCVLIDMGTKDDVKGTDWTKKMMDEMKSQMGGMDFADIGEKIGKLFSDGEGGLPQLPEKFLKGQIARLAEEIVKELNVEDFGLSAADLEESKKNPAKALEIMMNMFGKNPTMLQGTVQKLTKKLQQKIQSGAIRPKELMAEAEELMKVFSDNPKFVELMASFKNAFGAKEADFERAKGNQPNPRLSMVKDRLRKKLEERKKNK